MTCTSIVQLQERLPLIDIPESIDNLESVLNECVNTKNNISTNNMNNGLSNGHDLNFDFDSGHLISSSSFNTNTTELSSQPTNCVLNPSSSSHSILSNTGEKMGILENNEKSHPSKSYLMFKESKLENGQSLIIDPDSKWDIKTNLLEKVDSLPQIDSSTPISINKTINFNSENVTHAALIRDNLLNLGNSFLFQKSDEMKNLNLVQNCDEKNNMNSFNDLNNDQYIKKESPQHNPQISAISDPVPIEEEPSNEQLKTDQCLMLNYIDDLEHRIRKLQFHQTNRIINQQMKQFVNHQQRLNAVKCQRLELNVASFLNNYSQINNNTNLDVDVQNNFNSTNFSNVSIQVLNESPSPNVNLQNFLLNQPDCIQKYNDATTKQQPQQNSSNQIQQRNRVSQENQHKIFTTIEALRFNLRHCESKYDSDATDSSSGGESCDEMDQNEILSSDSAVPSVSTKNTSNM